MASKIKEALGTLTSDTREQLIYAFKYGVTQYVQLPGNRFIGVNCKGTRHLIIEEETENGWSTGMIKYPNGKA